MKNLCLILLAMAFSFDSNAQNSEANQSLSNVDPKFFIENKGQWPDEVLYLTRMGGLDVWITKQGINYTFFKIDEDSSMQRKKDSEFGPGGKFDHERLENSTLLGHRVILDLLGSSGNPTSEGLQKLAGYNNYFIGNDTSKYASNVGLYKEAVIKDVYNGIDMRYYFNNGNLQYDYIVNPGADPSQIQFRLRGQYEDYLKEQDLAFTTRFGEASLGELFTYQEGKAIESWFVKQKNNWQIALGEYDHSQTLIIDPLLYSTYIGGNSSDLAYGITVGDSGNAHVTGVTTSTNYDVTTGAFQTSLGGSSDVFVTKVNAAGTALIYSTYVGGSAQDYSEAISLDGSGNAYITGYTASTDFDVTTGAFQTSYGGNTYDNFVTKINSTGTSLLFSTYIGGSSYDDAYAICVDDSGNAYITGSTASTNYPVTTGAYQTSPDGNYEAFVTKVNVSGTALLYSTYIGGNSADFGHGICVDGSGNAYVTGYTYSTNFDVTTGAFQTSQVGGPDAFVTKVNSTGTALLYSTYLGANGDDRTYGICVDGSGNAYVTGTTTSTNFSVSNGAFQTNNGGSNDVFVAKFNTAGTALIYATYIGGSGGDRCDAISVDSSGNTYVAGRTTSSNYDVTSGAFQTSYGGGDLDVIVTKVNATGTDLIYSTYIGGSTFDVGYGISLDNSDNAYVTGYTNSTNYDVTTGAFQTNPGGPSWTYDVFVTKLDFCAATFDTISAAACDSYIWATSSLTYTASGAYNDTLTNAAGCDSILTLNLTIDSSNSGSATITSCDS